MLRYLMSTDCDEVCNYPLSSIERALEQAGIQHVLNPQNEAIVFATRAMARLRVSRNFYRSSAGPVFVSFMGYSENKIIPISSINVRIVWESQFLSAFART